MPVNQAPKAFMERYNRILQKEEWLDTDKKIADFWLFAVEQGKPRPEMRDYIASLVIEATDRQDLDSPSSLEDIGNPLYEAYGTWQYCKDLNSWYDPRHWKSMEEFYDVTWHNLELWVRELKEGLKN